jgi:hypothetical protein
MKKFWPLLLLLLPHQPIHAQEVHQAPTVEQCRADQRLWLNEVEQTNVSSSFPNLWAPEAEIKKCGSVDPNFDPRGIDAYANIRWEMIAEKALRLEHFLDRHPEIRHQFVAEDAQGKR